MNDRFKFRCFDKENKCMYYPTRYSNYSIVNGTVVKIESYPTANSAYLGKRISWEFDDAVIMQCTGLKDKSGKLVYEADIVKIQILEDFEAFGTNEKYIDIKSSIIYENSGFFIEQSDNDIFLGQIPQSDLEVIGNIYENKDLLNENS